MNMPSRSNQPDERADHARPSRTRGKPAVTLPLGSPLLDPRETEVFAEADQLTRCGRLEYARLICVLARGAVRVAALTDYLGGAQNRPNSRNGEKRPAQSKLSSRLGVLRKLGIVTFAVEGTNHFYTLTDQVHVEHAGQVVDLVLGRAGHGQIIVRLPSVTLGMPVAAPARKSRSVKPHASGAATQDDPTVSSRSGSPSPVRGARTSSRRPK